MFETAPAQHDGQEVQQRLDDLHDGVIQTLFGVGLTLQAAAAGAGEPLAARLEEAAQSLAAVVREIRDYGAAQQPATLPALDVERAIGAMARQVGDAGGMRFRVRIDPDAAAALDDRAYQTVEILGALLSELERLSRAGIGAIRLCRGRRWVRLEITAEGAGWPGPERARLHRLANRLGCPLEFARDQELEARATVRVPRS